MTQVRKDTSEQAGKNIDRIRKTLDTFIILRDGELMGEMITRWTYPYSGAMSHTTLILCDESGHEQHTFYEKAGGYGYNKESASIAGVLTQAVDVLAEQYNIYIPVETVSWGELGNYWTKYFYDAGCKVRRIF